jgi:hypothetical protein
VIDALVPLRDGTALVGEKALYRLLQWGHGRFEFVPGDVAEPARIRKPTRVALLEGMRQRDEWDQLCREMPPLDTRLRVAERGGSAALEPGSIAREVLEAVETYRRIDAVIDHCPHPDYEILRALSELLGRGEVRALAEEGRAALPGQGGLLGPVQLRRLREWTSGQRPRPGPLLKVLVAAPESALVAALVDLLREATDFVVDARLLREPRRLQGLCILGHVPLAEGLSLRLIALPTDPVYEPLWDVACHGMLGAILLLGSEGEAGLEETEHLFHRLRERSGRPVVHALLEEHTPAPIALRERIDKLGGEGAIALAGGRAEATEALRELFARLLP